MWDTVKFTAITVVFLAFAMGVIVGVAGVVGNHSDHVSCLRLSEQTGFQTRYARSGMLGECYINIGGQWIPEDRWRNISG